MSASLPEESLGPPTVALRVGEGVVLEAGSEPVALSSHQEAYLLLLAGSGEEGIPRSRVIRLLWDRPETQKTRHRLRQLSYTLNRKAGSTFVEARGTLVALAKNVVVEFRCEGVGEAVAPPTPGFDDWVAELRERRAREVRLGSVRELDAGRLADHPEAVLASLAEGHRTPGSWRDLLWALLRTGRVREAEFELRRVLGDDVPMEGLPTARRIASHKDRILSLASAGGEASIPLEGRDEEVRHLHDLMVSGSACVLITGAHGVGRSRILGQAVATLLANKDDTVMLAAHGMPFERHTPFGGLGQLLSEELLIQAFAELGQPETEIIRRALPAQFETQEEHVLANIGGPGSYLRVARAVADLFQRAYGQAEVMLLVDDLDQLDRSSVEVLTRLVLVSNARLLGTWCTEGENGLNELLFRFRGIEPDIVPLLDLPLPRAAALARAVAPDLGEKQWDDIARLGGGRPGRVVELIRALAGSPILSSPMGPSLDEILRRRVRSLTPAEQQALVLLAVSGGRLEIPSLGKLLGVGVLEIAGHVRSMEEAGLVRVEGSRAAVAPGLLRDFVARELPGPLRRETHASIADHLIGEGDAADPGFLAHHLMEAGRPLEAAVWFKRAGFAARDRTAYAEALVLLERSVAANDELDPEIAKELGTIHSGMGDFKQAIHWFGRARIGYVDRGDEVGDVEVGIEEARVRLKAGQQGSIVLESTREQLARAKGLGSTYLISLAIGLWLEVSEYSHNRAWVEEATGVLLSELDEAPHCEYLAYTGAHLAHLGWPSRGRWLARRAYLASRSVPDLRLSRLNRLILANWVTDGLGPGTRSVLITNATALAKRTGNLIARFDTLANAGSWYMDQGQWDEAEACLCSAEGLFEQPSVYVQRFVAINRAILRIRQSGALSAADQLEILDDLGDSPRASAVFLTAAIRLLVRLEEGRLEEANAISVGLEQMDLTYPFSSNMALVPIARAELLRRRGKRGEAIKALRTAADSMRLFCMPAARQIAERLAQVERGSPAPIRS